MGRTHLALGALILFLLAKFTNWIAGYEITAAVLILLASILPDIDSSTSFLGRKFKLLKNLLKHRGFFHSIFAMTTFTIIVYAIFQEKILSWIFLIGYASHLLADSVTKEGTKLFYPRDLKVKGPLRVGSFAETVIIFILVVLTVHLLI